MRSTVNPAPQDRPAAARHPSGAARQALLWALTLSSMISTPVLAAQTDISSAPITSTNAAQVKPNIMLLMDTSGSMGWGHMPDEVESQVGYAAIGYKAAQCNVLYYKRDQAYATPKQANGLPFATPSFTGARYDAFDIASFITVDLSSAFKAYDDNTLRTSGSNDTPQPAYYYYKTGGTVPIAAYNASPCLDGDAGASMPSSDGGIWNRVTVGPSSGVGGVDERNNFAIWYSYYRTRILLIKSAASLAFTPLTDSFRVGFITVKPKDNKTDLTINPAKYLPIDDFGLVQRGLWFDKLFSQKPGGSSPTREGLARVGRHYAGKHDGINAGMTGDPVQYSCQQNFTIMTTDGYWNVDAESAGLGGGYLGGPVDISGKALVGQRDGTLDGVSTNNPSPPPAADINVTPRPIYDGQFDGVHTITSKNVHYAYQACGTYFSLVTIQINATTSQLRSQTVQTTQSTVQNLQSTTQALQSTSQTRRSTSQTTQSTVQNLASTRQNLRTTAQRLQSTSQITTSTLQNLQATNQNLQTTTQNLQSTSQSFMVNMHTEKTVRTPRQTTVQNLQSTSQTRIATSQQNRQTTQALRTTTQNLASTTLTNRNTSQTTQASAQPTRSTTQNLQSTTQNTQSTSQVTQSTAQITGTSSQILVSTAQTQTATSQVRRSTSQLRSCDASTELCTPTPVGSCTPGGSITCQTVTTGPTLVASCSAQSASAGNNWTSTTCAVTGTGPAPTAACTPAPADSGNTYTTTTCSSATTGPTPAASCNASPASVGNAYTATTCSTSSTGPVPAASCAPQLASAGNSYTTVSCNTVTTGPTAAAACAPQPATAGNTYTATTCGSNNTSNVAVSSCSVSGPTLGNAYTTTTCGTNNSSNIAVQTCSASGPTAGNSWTTTTCSTNNTGPTAVSTCTGSAATAGNGWTTTNCASNNTSTPSGTCSPSGPTALNNWTTTTCPTLSTGPTPVSPAACTPAGGSALNSWTTTTCPVTNTGPTAVPSCSNAAASVGTGWVATTCSTNNANNTPVASCTPSSANVGNGYTTTTCGSNNSAVTPVSSCSAVAAGAGNAWTATLCPIVTTGPTPISSCAPQSAGGGNSYTATTCPTATSGPTPVSSCTGSLAAAGNGWTTTTCSTNNTTNAAVASCTASGPSAGNGWTTTTCPPETLVSGPTNVASCTPTPASAGNGFQRTDCQTITDSTPVQAGTCVVVPPSVGNNYVGTTCTTTTTANQPVASCTPQTASAGNSWFTITCATNNNFNVPVATCAASGPSVGNGWVTTTCPAPITTGPTPVASCTATPASAGNTWTSTICPAPITSGPTGVSSCSNVAASVGNSWTATICGNPTTTNVAVSSCTDTPPSAGSQWTTTTCSDNIVANTPVVSCSPQGPVAGNSWTTTTCPPANVTTSVPVASCTPVTIANAGNSFTTRSCSTNNTTNVPSGSCAPSSSVVGNGYTTTTCPVLLTGPTGVASCTPAPGDAGNGWITTTCGPNNTTNVAVATCNPSAPSAGNGYTTVTCSANSTSNVAVTSCTGSAPTAGNGYTTTSCSTNNTTSVPVASCTPSAASAGNGWTTTTCPVNDSGAIGASSCTPSGPTALNNWTTTTCPGVLNTGPSPVATCAGAAAAAGNAWTTTTCSSVVSVPVIVTACVPISAGIGNAYTATSCTPAGGSQLTTTTTTRVQQYNVSGGRQASIGTDTTTTDGPNASGVCYAPGTAPALAVDGPPAWTAADAAANPSCTAWPCTADANTNDPRSINSLADVAQYYYVTDLRTAANEPRGPDYYRDDVPGVGSGAEDDRVRWQHMTTFSIALGVSGSLRYQTDYKTSATGDFADIRTGAKNWPLWPDPAAGYYTDPNNYNDPRAIDDFWHAAVNGRGTYFSASNPTSVIAGLSNALAGITARVASSTGAGVSNLEPVAGDNFVYLANYTTQKWSGDVQAHEVDPTTGVVQTPVIWSAQAKLDATTASACDSRRIMLMRMGATDNLVDFTWTSKSCDLTGNPTGAATTGLNASEQSYFGALNVSLLSQYPSMTDGTAGTVDQRSAAVGAPLVNFLRGQRSSEDFTANDASKFYRKRDHVLGDTVNGQPVYVRSPFATYTDAGYAAFKTAQAARTPMLYVPANDGMLHAFYAGTSLTDATGGREAWAIVPSAVLPNLYKLADANYKNNHQYSVDGTPAVSDVYDGSNWHTVLVAGLNAGGRGFYAVDVTQPNSPKAMWEFKWSDTCYSVANALTAGADCHVGLSFGKPLVTKLADGRWVVMVTSGYNNVNAPAKAGDGVGYLYVLNATTGQIIYKISTGVGDTTTPSGLAQINNFVDKAEIDNTSVRIYGTDLLGNIWRFDVNDNTPPVGREATLVGTAKDSLGVPQPITTRPELTQLGGKPMLFVATGKLLGATDVADLQTQSIYGIVDPISATTAFANLRAALAPLAMTQTGGGTGATRSIACTGTTAQCGSTDGWRIDLPDSGERVNVEMKLRASTLVIGSNVPQISACTAGGYSWLNFVNFRSGLAVRNATGIAVSEQVANSLIVGLTVIQLSSGQIKAIGTTSDGGVLVRDVPTSQDPSLLKRISWREVTAK